MVGTKHGIEKSTYNLISTEASIIFVNKLESHDARKRLGVQEESQ
jgi:hypothetical protein